MKVLYVNRNPNSWLGGDVLKMLNFKKYIEVQGVEVYFDYRFEVDYKNYDVIHTFGINFPWAYKTMQTAKAHKKPLVVSSIFFDNVGSVEQVREIINYASAIIVFSIKEIDAIKQWTNIGSKYDSKFVIIENGVDEKFYSDNEKRDIDVLMVGSFHPRKQQDVVCEVCNQIGIKPSFLGTKHTKPFYEYCVDNFDLNYIGVVDQSEMNYYYGRAKVVIQPSLIDPFPNTLLESGLAGCQFILSKATYVPDDFPNIKFVDPNDREGMKNYIKELLKIGINKDLSKYIKKNYKWEDKAKLTINLYKKCIQK